MSTMRAIGAFTGLPISDENSLQDVTVDLPTPARRDLLVRINAVSVNPVDVKRRAASKSSETTTILGYDAAGVVEAVGSGVTLFTPGDEVFYAGAVNRPGSNAEFQLVDERLVGRKPSSLDFADAAALPLTTITAWEILFDRFGLTQASTGTLLVLGAAGGVGSMALQLASTLTSLTVLGSGSREESRQWARRMGAHDVVNHHDLVASVGDRAPAGVDYLLTPHSSGNATAFAQIVRPFGHIGAIDDPKDFDFVLFKGKSVTWHWESMFTRSTYMTDDMAEQGALLNRVGELVDATTIESTATEYLTDFTAAGLRRAHELVETGSMIGKVVIARRDLPSRRS